MTISRLRKRFATEHVEDIRGHLAETYSWFLHNGCTITLNGIVTSPLDYDAWAFPKGHAPHSAKFDVMLENDKVEVEITAGLITDRDPEQENYGVYVYCNNRLIVKDYKTRDVGYFITGEAGVPHPDASMCRAIVRLTGAARHMPWNSSKNGINTGHTVFQHLRPTLIKLVSHFSALSRRLKNDWDNKVTSYTSGTIEMIPIADIAAGKNLHLPTLPPGNKRQVEQLKARNKKVLQNMPWTIGLVESMAALDVITRQRFDTKNRIALILLDSNFEIGLKEFIVSRTDLFPAHAYTDARILQIFKQRTTVIAEVTAHVPIPATTLAKARHYYNLRNKLIHERATVGITDADVETYRKTIQEVLNMLFKLKFAA